MRSAEALRRHDFVWLAPRLRPREVQAATSIEAETVLRWVGCGRPLVTARQSPGTPSTWCDFGLALPPQQGRRRISLRAPAEAVASVRPPPVLPQVIPSAPPHWRAPLRALAAAGLRFRVYGSLAWQHLVGVPYVTARSDIDLLWQPADLRALEQGVAVLQGWERRYRLKADGEILLPDGSAVAWREFAARPDRLMVKGTNELRLRPTSDLLRLIAKGYA